MTPAFLNVLIKHGELTTEQAHLLSSYKLEDSTCIENAVLGVIPSNKLGLLVSKIFAIDHVDLNTFDFKSTCEALGLNSLIQKHQALPINKTAHSVTLAISDPTNSEIEDEFRFATGLQVELVIADISSIKKAIYSLYGRNLQSDGGDRKSVV